MDSAASKEASELEKRNKQLQEQLAAMAKQQQEMANQLQELTKSAGGETPATTAAVTSDPGASAQVEKVEPQERKPKVEPGVGDSMDADWETVSHSKPRVKKARERRAQERVAPTPTIFGSTALPEYPPELISDSEDEEGNKKMREPKPAVQRKKVEAPVRPVQPDGLDQRDWSEPIRTPLKGDNRMRVGQPGICLCTTHEEVVALLHDLQQTTVPAAMLTFEEIEGSHGAPARIWKDNYCSVKHLWLFQLGTGESGPVTFLKDPKLSAVADSTWQEVRSTVVVILQVMQAWVTVETWKMWAPPTTRVRVARRYMEIKGVTEAVEDIFHPKLFGAEPDCTATLTLRVLVTGLKDVIKLKETDPPGVTFKVLDADGPQQIVWLGRLPP